MWYTVGESYCGRRKTVRHATEYQTVVWDFNGTLLDDLGIGIASINALLARRGMPLVESHDAYHRIFCFPIREYYRRLGFEFFEYVNYKLDR